ncbi:MAG: hypothetical protein ACM3U2_19425 [Deltaproteobacteria bacterium]
MSLSNAGVNRLLNDKFVCAYVNTKGDPNSGESFSHHPRDPVGPCLRGNGEHNVQMITISPAGEIFHVLSGYVGPEELLAELQFAEATGRELAKIKDSARRKAFLVAAHEKFTRELARRRFDEDPASRMISTPGLRDLSKQFQPPFGPEMQNLMAGFTGERGALDHAFVIKHPLLPYKEYRSEDLVGNARTFFGSTSFGTDGAGEYGELPAAETDTRTHPRRRPKKDHAKRTSPAAGSRNRDRLEQ